MVAVFSVSPLPPSIAVMRKPTRCPRLKRLLRMQCVGNVGGLSKLARSPQITSFPEGCPCCGGGGAAGAAAATRSLAFLSGRLLLSGNAGREGHSNECRCCENGDTSQAHH